MEALETMLIADAQREVRDTYLGGSVGQTVSATIWAIAASISTWLSHRSGMAALVLGGFFIFPLTTLVLRLIGRRAALSGKNPFRALAMQVAFVLPRCVPARMVLSGCDDLGWRALPPIRNSVWTEKLSRTGSGTCQSGCSLRHVLTEGTGSRRVGDGTGTSGFRDDRAGRSSRSHLIEDCAGLSI
jgi:hypothetical protein